MEILFCTFQSINLIIPIRLSKAEEILGADFNEHDIRHDGYDYEGMKAALQNQGCQMHHTKRPYAPPRSEWDEYLMDKYLLNERGAHEANGNHWERRIQNGSMPTGKQKEENIPHMYC